MYSQIQNLPIFTCFLIDQALKLVVLPDAEHVLKMFGI